MKPIPVDFHVGPLQVHTYGIGLAITFYFAYWYFGRRLRDHGYPTAWLGGTFIWIIVAAIVGARVTHVLSNLSFYTKNPGEVLAVWHGGLSSFGGLLFAVPVAIYLTRKRCPELTVGRGLDLVAPVLMAAWAIGRLLGPQVMVAGGGKPTSAWFGMYYAGQVGKRIPAPVFQSLECLAILFVLFWIERRVEDGPNGVVIASAGILWGLDRFLDEVFWLAVPQFWDLVEVVGLVMFLGSSIALGVILLRWRRQVSTAEPGAVPGRGGHRDLEQPTAPDHGVAAQRAT